MPLSVAVPALPSFRKQHLLVEFSRLRYAQLDGVFLSITPGDPSLWLGVIFVRKGPYAPAVLRFQISFPPTYPALPPLVTFSTDVFHPLLTPLTTYTYTTGSTDTDTVSATDEERLPPGGFSLRHGFPHWFGRSRKMSAPNSRDASGSALASPASTTPVPSDLNASSGTPNVPQPTQEVSIVRILEYIRSTFSEESILDSLPLEAAANPGAFHAWRAHRAPIVQAQQPTSPSPEPSTSEKSEGSSTLGRNRRPGEWNWEGVWEERVRKAVKASLSEPVLYGTSAGEDIIRFREADEEMQEKMKSSHKHCDNEYVFGPLDDIIDEIKSDIWESPSDCGFDLSVLDCACPLEAPLLWTTAPLPVSRIPKDHTLTIPKHRNSRSTASGSSLGDPMAHPYSTGHDAPVNGGPVRSPHTTTVGVTSYEPAASNSSTPPKYVTAQQALENVVSYDGGPVEPPRGHTSMFRRLTSGLTLLRRQGTGDTSVSINAPEASSPTTASTLATHDEDSNDPNDAAIEAWLWRKASDGEWFNRFMGLATKHMPSPADHRDDVPTSPPSSPSLLKPEVKVFSEVRILTKEVEDFTVAIDIEGVLHNRKLLPDTSIDVICVVDNGYYVTRDCLEKALDAVKGTYLAHGDRLALYTTHCTHHRVTGNRPELMLPIRPKYTDTGDKIQKLAHYIMRSGTQLRQPPRPNPCMAEVIICIARSMQDDHLKASRTHFIVLTPAAHLLHGVSRYFPDLYIHQINPAILPYCPAPEFEDKVCVISCCKKVFASNMSKYQLTSARIKSIIKDARSVEPVGELTDISLDFRTKTGCKIIECIGSKEVPQLHLGQLHTIFLRIRVTKAEIKSVDLDSTNRIFNSSLSAKGLRQELQNSVQVGADKVHLLDVQVLHRNSIHDPQTWNYTERPVIVIRKLGSLAPPQDTSMDVYNRLYFYKLTHALKDDIKLVAEGTICTTISNTCAEEKRLKADMFKELNFHAGVHEYETQYRQKLPLCPGPIDMEFPHDWLIDLWNRTKARRKGIDGLERLA
ncbi:Ubiquitin-protein ligase [Pyrenophora tritici-repentis]|nr:Ubiquitin-protein ligase [Pyrenophora tritici-repentis]